jgi:capsid protein
MLIAERVKGFSDTYDIIEGSPLLSIIPLDAQMSAYPASLPYYNYGYTQPAGGKFFDDLDNYAPETITDHWAARAQAKKLDSQSIETRKVINRKNSYVVGRGLRLKPTPDHEIIGISLEEASDWGKNVGGRYALWAKSKDSDVTGVNNLYQNQRFAHRGIKLLGEGFARFTYSDDPNLLNPLQIGFLDPNQIRGDELTFSSGPESQDDGLIKDKNGKTIGFKVWVTDPQNPGRYKEETIPAVDSNTGLPLMIHLYEPKHAGQTRGITDLLPAISDFEKITGYKTAALDRMKNGSSRDYVIENMQKDPSPMDISAMNAESAGTLLKTETGDETPASVALPWRNAG